MRHDIQVSQSVSQSVRQESHTHFRKKKKGWTQRDTRLSKNKEDKKDTAGQHNLSVNSSSSALSANAVK